MNGLSAALPFFSSKRPAPVVRKEYVVNSQNTDGLTGVERYLGIITPEVTGVSTYLENLKMNQPATAETGVARYLEKTEKKAEAAVIVVRYLDEEAKAAKKEAKVEPIITPDETGVTRYLNSIAGVTGVTSYLIKKDAPTQEAVAAIINKCLEAEAIPCQEDEITETGVARYIDNKSKITGVSKYLAKQDGSTQKAVDAIIDRCLKEEAISASQKEAESIHDASIISGVSKYIDKQTSATGVARYLAKDDESVKETVAAIIARCLDEEANSAKEQPASSTVEPVTTSVSEYLQSLPSATGVARYLARQDVSAKEARAAIIARCLTEDEASAKLAAAIKEDEKNLEDTDVSQIKASAPTGVALYLERNNLSPLTGVGKYLTNHAVSERQTSDETDLTAQEKAATEAIIARYHEKETLSSQENEKAKVSGVSSYLEKRAESSKKTTDSTLTGVAAYLEGLEMTAKGKAVKQAIISKCLEKEALDVKKAEEAKATKVEKYMARQVVSNQEATHSTKVAGYIARFERNTAAKAIVKRCLEEESVLAQRAAKKNIKTKAKTHIRKRTTGVDKYLKKHAVPAKVNPAATGVASYLQEQISTAKVKEIAAILAKYRDEDALAAKKAKEAVLSSVEKYLIKMISFPRKKPSETGVSKYLDKKIKFANEMALLSGVEKYMRTRA